MSYYVINNMQEHLDQLVDYIQKALRHGLSEDHIRQSLAQNNWHPDHVDQGFAIIKGSTRQSHPLASPSVGYEAPNTNQAAGQPQTQAVRHKYKLFRAIADVLAAIRFDIKSFLLTFLATYIVAGLSLILVVFINGQIIIRVNSIN
jgi:hypothetical protein